MTHRMVDNDVYQKYIFQLVREGHNGLSILDNLLKLASEHGQMEMEQLGKDMSEHELIKIDGMDEAYSNVEDLIDFIKEAIGDKK